MNSHEEPIRAETSLSEDGMTAKQLPVRKRGRPPGSKNKTTLLKEDAKAVATAAAAASADEDDGDNPEASTSAQPVSNQTPQKVRYVDFGRSVQLSVSCSARL
jgi:hypothetical protein